MVQIPPKKTSRRDSGLRLFQEGKLKRQSDGTYLVQSRSTPGKYYLVTLSTQVTGASCQCEDNFFRKRECQHIHAARISELFFFAVKKRCEYYQKKGLKECLAYSTYPKPSHELVNHIRLSRNEEE